MQPETSQGSLVARTVSQWERALLAQWFTGTDRTGTAAIAAAYVSERSRDDPRLRNMIVVAEHAKSDIAYLLHRPLGEAAWILTSGRTGDELGRYRTLPEALNMIRPSRGIGESQPIAEAHHSEAHRSEAHHSEAWMAATTSGR